MTCLMFPFLAFSLSLHHSSPASIRDLFLVRECDSENEVVGDAGMDITLSSL